jgi:threonine synthase
MPVPDADATKTGPDMTRTAPSQASRTDGRFALNPALAGFACIRCGTALPVGDYFEGCPACLDRGEPSSVRSVFARSPEALSDPARHGMARYAAWMPYSDWVSLGEGGTSCESFASLADEVKAAAVFIKNEGQNPSGSHKDRSSCLAVTRALDVGASGIVAASSGNGGASVALYAAAAGLPCRIVTTPSLSAVHRRAIAMTGAELITAAESLDRWRLVREMVGEGWFPATNYLIPPVGSNHFGTDGLKSVAFEIFEELGDQADVVIVPTSRGDLIWGLYEGFRELEQAGLLNSMPRLFAAEPFPRISRVLAGEEQAGSFPGTTALASIGGTTVTYQSVVAVQANGGGAVVVDDEAVMRDQLRLARHGCYMESASAATLTGLEILLKEGRISSGDRVVLIATSNGYKELADGEGGR